MGVARVTTWIHDLALALLVGGIAAASGAAVILFDRAPSREIAGQIGNAIFGRLAAAVLVLSLAVLATRVALERSAPASRARSASLAIASSAVVLAAIIAFWLTPRMGSIWTSAPHDPGGAGLMGDDKRRFMMLHGLGNLAYLSIMAAGVALIVLGHPAGRPRSAVSSDSRR